MLTRPHPVGLIALALVGAVLAPTVASAQDETGPFDDFSAGIDLGAYSKYVWRGINTVDDFVLQPSVDLALGNLGLNIWGNLDLTDQNDREWAFTEVDVTGSYSFSLDRFDFSFGAVGYIFPGAAGETTELFASIGIANELAPTLTIYRDVDEVDGAYVTLSGGYTFEDPFDLGEALGVSPEFSVSVGYGNKAHNSFYYGDPDAGLADLTLGLTVPYRLCDSATLGASVHYSRLLSGDIRDLTEDEDNLWFGLSLSISF